MQADAELTRARPCCRLLLRGHLLVLVQQEGVHGGHTHEDRDGALPPLRQKPHEGAMTGSDFGPTLLGLLTDIAGRSSTVLTASRSQASAGENLGMNSTAAPQFNAQYLHRSG